MASKAVWAGIIVAIIIIACVVGYFATRRPAVTTTTSSITTSTVTHTLTVTTTSTTTSTSSITKSLTTTISKVKTTTSTATKTTIKTTTKTVTTTSPVTSIPPSKRVLRIAFAWPTYIDPAVGSDYSSSTALANLYDPLVWPLPNGSVKPWVAVNWTVSKNGTVWTFWIRKGIKFHDGDELTAEDVAFSMKRLMTIGQGFAYLFLPYVKDVKVLGKYKVQFILKKPFGPFLECLCRLYIVDKKAVMEHIVKPGPYGKYGDFATKWLLTHDAGSGPYMVKRVKLESYIEMVKFPGYWNKKAVAPNSPDVVIFLASGGPTMEATMLARRTLEISSQWLPQETLSQVAKIKGISIAKIPMPTEFYLMMNCRKPPLDDVHVRRALAYAFDYEAVVKYIFPGNILADGPVPHILPGWCHVPQYKRNLALAKAELKKSKYYPDIIKHPDKYVITFWWCAEVPDEEKVALLFAKCAAEIGLKVKVVKTPWAKMVEYMAKLQTSPHIASVFVAANFPEAGGLLWTKYSSQSAPTWMQNEWLLNKTLDKWMEKALSTLNRTKRFEMYCQIEKYINKICPDLFLFDQVAKFAYQSAYVYWPQAVNRSKVVPVMGYNIICRQIQVFPEKRAKLLHGGGGALFAGYSSQQQGVPVINSSSLLEELSKILKLVSFNQLYGSLLYWK